MCSKFPLRRQAPFPSSVFPVSSLLTLKTVNTKIFYLFTLNMYLVLRIYFPAGKFYSQNKLKYFYERNARRKKWQKFRELTCENGLHIVSME